MEIIDKEELVAKVGDLKVLPFVARKVLETLSDDNCSIDSLSSIIEKDQSITVRVLKISNSALYGLRQQVTSLNQALLLLGFKTIRSLVLSASTKSLYKKFGMTEKIIWDHSVGAAIASKIISSGMGSEVEEIAFIGGLMHDLGKVIMNNETPEHYSQVMMNVYNEGTGSIAAEEEVYGYNHTEIGSRIVDKWGFAPLLAKVIQYHHLDMKKLDDIGDSAITNCTACVHLADHICKILGIGFRDRDESIELERTPSAVYLGMNKETLDRLLETIDDAYKNEKSVFD